MKNIYSYILTILMILPLSLLAQNYTTQRVLIGSLGNTGSTGSKSVSQSIGEVIILTGNTGQLDLSQGFHQVYSDAGPSDPDPVCDSLFIPNLITPAPLSVGKNDRWEIRGLKPGDLVSVYTRWGKEIFGTATYTGNWDGDDLPAGTYYYSIKKEDSKFCTGTITILR
ncbi:MAG: gliding motility-associated C-terminal domain-containing protein [Bacteroidota bacterium]